MPIYEYRCPECSHTEVCARLIKHRDSPIKCEKCGVEMKRILSIPTVNGNFTPIFHRRGK